MRVLLHYDAGPMLARRLDDLAEEGLRIAVCPAADAQLFAAMMREAEVLWHVLEPVTAAQIAAAQNLKLIQKIGVGVNTIDLEAAKARGVRVCNMPGTNSRAVAEATLLLMLAALRRLPFLDTHTRAGAGWDLEPGLQDGLGEIAGRTVGLVGFGSVPELLAPMLTALGARVIYAARSKKEVPYERLDLDALLAEADIVSLHLPLTEETADLIGQARIRAMKPGAVLINTARGGLVDEAALAEALTDGQLRAAGLDVFAAEPVAADSPLLALPNVALMPHVAWLTQETLARSLAIAVENCRRLRDGSDLLHQVL